MRAAAKQLGVSTPMVGRGIKSGRLNHAVLADGTIDMRVAVREWVENADHTHGQKGGNVAGTHNVNGAASTLQQAKAAHAAFDAKMAEIAYKKAIGEVVPVKEMREAMYDVARRVRDRLQTLPARIAPVVAGLAGDRDACYLAVEVEVNEVLDDLAALTE